jgi:4-hydroxythreonine-4-phosphate dehydrogenase
VTRLAVSIGCPSGIGPEVSLAGAVAITKLKTRTKPARVLLVGDLGVLRAAAKVIGIDPARLVVVDDVNAAFTLRDRSLLPVLQPTKPLAANDRAPGKPSRAGGAAQLAWIDAASDVVSRGEGDALVTGPVSKDAIARSGAPGSRAFRGHTEHLAARLDAPEVTMAFWTEKLTTSLVTTHLPLAKVPRAITSEEVARAAYWTAQFVATLASSSKTRAEKKPLAIAALNPHAGEHGLLGHEEERTITPGIALARRRLAKDRVRIDLAGPVPAESAFRRGANGDFCGVVAMYHDQATIPMKLLGFGEAVNVSLGLPIVRTSVDHGTAYDRAGKGTADAHGMIEAMRLALRIAPQ